MCTHTHVCEGERACVYKQLLTRNTSTCISTNRTLYIVVYHKYITYQTKATHTLQSAEDSASNNCTLYKRNNCASVLSVLSHSTAASYGLQLGLQKKSCDSSVPSRFFFFFFFSVLKLDTSRRVKYKTPTPTTMADLDPQWPRFSVTTTTCREKTKYHITPCQAMYHGYYIHIYRSMPCRYPDLGHKAQRSSRYPDLGHKAQHFSRCPDLSSKAQLSSRYPHLG